MKIKSLVLIIIEYVRELYNISLLPIIYEPYGFITLQEEKELLEKLEKSCVRS